MADESWQQIRKIFDDALRHKPAERQRFVEQACVGNKTLLTEVESLLSSLDSAEEFLETPAVAKVADFVAEEGKIFEPGQCLGHYEIVRQLGSGGMGTVYLARDTKLQRRVALKVLRENALSDERSNHKLLREARAAALLEHPNICAIYEISETPDCNFIVMQFVDGETLADILTKENLTLEISLDLAIQIADGLSEAHLRGIIHRDIKPANIMVNDKMQAKILDFGLAKFIGTEVSLETAGGLNSSGAVMGTVPFMSPEQLRGEPVDARSDIFSLGALLYEMLTGRQAYGRETNAETISATLNDEPDWSDVPPELQPILRKSLMKNRESRCKSAAELARDLRVLRDRGGFNDRKARAGGITSRIGQDVSNEPTLPDKREFYFWQSGKRRSHSAAQTAEINEKPTREALTARFNPLILFTVLVFFSVIGASALYYWQSTKNDDSRSFDALRPVRLISWKAASAAFYTDYRVSNSGKMVAYSSSQAGGSENIYVRLTSGGEEIRVTKDEAINVSPVWSPDDQRIAYSSIRESQVGIYLSPALGGTSVPLKTIGKGDVYLRHWSNDDTAIFYEHQGNLFRLDLVTRESSAVTDMTTLTRGERYFSISPAEDQIVFCDQTDGQSDIWTVPLKGGEKVRLTNDGSEKRRPRWHPDGMRIFYNVQRDSFQQISLAYIDGRAPVQVTRGDSQYEMIDVSADGTKIYYFAVENRSDISGVRIEKGQEFEFEVATGIEFEQWADISPNGKSIVYQSAIAPQFHKTRIIVKAVGNETPTLNIEGYNPHWLPDSRHVWFTRLSEADKRDHAWLVDTANGEEKQIQTMGVYPPSISFLPRNRGEIGNLSWSPDGVRFVYLDSTKQKVTLASIESAETIDLTPVANVRYFSPLFSADGKRIVFLSSEQSSDQTTTHVWLWEAGKHRKIHSTADGVRLLGWSSAGDVLLRLTDGVMKALPMDVKLLLVSLSGNNRIISTFKNIYPTSMSLSADARTVAFTARQNDKDDIWIAAVGSGEPRKLTANGNTRLYYGSLEWSPDGQTVFFDKQEQIDTISMFENLDKKGE